MLPTCWTPSEICSTRRLVPSDSTSYVIGAADIQDLFKLILGVTAQEKTVILKLGIDYLIFYPLRN